MSRVLRLIVFFVLATSTAEAQGNLSEFFSIIRREGRTLSESSRTRTSEILDSYATGTKPLDGEWQAINDALTDASPFIREQACAALAFVVYVNSTPVYVNPVRPIGLPDTTRDLVIQKLSEASPGLRENAVRIIVLAAGGVPPGVAPQLLNMARRDSANGVRRVAIAALASIPTPPSEIVEFWLQSLNDVPNKELRGMVLGAFRSYAQTDPRVISLVIDALRDPDYFVRQEAIASIVRIGKPAAAALPLLIELRDAPVSDELGASMRSNAESAIRILSGPPGNR